MSGDRLADKARALADSPPDKTPKTAGMTPAYGNRGTSVIPPGWWKCLRCGLLHQADSCPSCRGAK